MVNSCELVKKQKIMNTTGQEYLRTLLRRVKYYKDLGERTFEQMEEKDFHYRPNEESNSMAIIVQHMTGNMLSRFTNFLTEDGEKEWRQRDDEFNVHQYTQEQVMKLWNKGWSCFLDCLESLQEEDLMKTVTIRGEPLSVIDALNRQLAHYAYHIGQLLYLGKMIQGKDWKSLSIPRGESGAYNQSGQVKDPARKF
jgi:hypothetical protein